VIVVGLGGVGSHAVNMLVRSGVARVRLIDFDQVTLSSLNRHAIAALGDVGQSKAIGMLCLHIRVCGLHSNDAQLADLMKVLQKKK